MNEWMNGLLDSFYCYDKFITLDKLNHVSLSIYAIELNARNIDSDILNDLSNESKNWDSHNLRS